jgi:capsular exopolysaccharide synthesis family protein
MRETAAAAVEQYRKLAATLHLSHIQRELKVIMVTSAVPGDGKTLTAVNLALTLSGSYRRRVLLIDADLRRPALSDVFQLPSVVGLTGWLKGPSPRKLSVIKVSDQLALLPAGQPDPDPISGLTSERMRRLLKDAATSFDWVILDTPPIGLLTDANLLGEMVDGALLVVRAKVTPYALIQRAVQALGRDRLLGVVMNCTDEGITQHAYCDYY